MAGSAPQVQLHKWQVWWLTLSIPVVVWDALGSLLRPWTLEDGPLFSIWAPYKLYGTIDLIYSPERWHAGDRFCEAQSVCNLLEVGLQILALVLWRRRHPAAVLAALIAVTMTFWKTTLYWLYDILGNMKHTGHNPLATFIVMYVLPNALWIVIPFLIIVNLSVQLLRVLNHTQPSSTDAKLKDQ